VEDPRWRPLIRNGCVITHILACKPVISEIRYNGHIYVFRVKLTDGASSDSDRPNEKWEIQDGGRITSTMRNSACRRAIDKLPTARPMFSESGIWTVLFPILHDLTGSWKLKILAGNRKWLWNYVYLNYKIATTLQRLQQFRACQLGWTSANTVRCQVEWDFKDGSL